MGCDVPQSSMSGRSGTIAAEASQAEDGHQAVDLWLGRAVSRTPV